MSLWRSLVSRKRLKMLWSFAVACLCSLYTTRYDHIIQLSLFFLSLG